MATARRHPTGIEAANHRILDAKRDTPEVTLVNSVLSIDEAGALEA